MSSLGKDGDRLSRTQMIKLNAAALDDAQCDAVAMESCAALTVVCLPLTFITRLYPRLPSLSQLYIYHPQGT